MHKKNKLILPLMLVCFNMQLAFGQELDTQAKDLILINKYFGQGKINYYNDKIKLTAGQTCQFTSGSAEKVFCEFFNAKDDSTLKSFFLESLIPKTYSGDYLDKMKLYFESPEKNFYELESTVELENGVSKSLFIKYINHNQNFPKPISSIVYMELVDTKWQIKELGAYFETAIFLTMVKSKILSDCFNNKLSETDKKTISSYITGGSIDLKKLISAFFTLKKNNPNDSLVKLLYDTEFSIF